MFDSLTQNIDAKLNGFFILFHFFKVDTVFIRNTRIIRPPESLTQNSQSESDWDKNKCSKKCVLKLSNTKCKCFMQTPMICLQINWRNLFYLNDFSVILYFCKHKYKSMMHYHFIQNNAIIRQVFPMSRWQKQNLVLLL